jgi:phosphohistidine phosphatase SixA
MMRELRLLALFMAVFSTSPAAAADLNALLPKLKEGGYVIVVRHVATDDSQKDVYPFKFDDIKAQRQLSEQGRQVAREFGQAIKTLGIPVGEVYSSKLNRAVETAALISGKQAMTVSDLTDSSAGSASGMANPAGANAKIGAAIRALVNAAPKAGTNNFVITHKTNIADAFGKPFGEVKDGEALIYKPDGSGTPTLVDRVQPNEWIAGAAGR